MTNSENIIHQLTVLKNEIFMMKTACAVKNDYDGAAAFRDIEKQLISIIDELSECQIQKKNWWQRLFGR
jgi:hypothetical protein